MPGTQFLERDTGLNEKPASSLDRPVEAEVLWVSFTYVSLNISEFIGKSFIYQFDSCLPLWLQVDATEEPA